MRKREIKLRKQLQDRLREKYELGHGMKKHDIKDNHNATPFIHSTKTFQTYRQQVGHFADWCKAQGIKDYPTAVKAVPEYMRKLDAEGKSASSQTTALCALAKCMDKSTLDFEYKVPVRQRSDIVRSRTPAQRDKHFSGEKNKDLIAFCESTGVRRDELTHLFGSNLEFKDGKAYLHITNGTKGGKGRYAEIIGNKKLVMSMCQRAGHGKVFPKVHSCADIHGYRASYATALYRQYARPLEQIPKEDRYICRGDYKGKIFDKKAMAIVSQALGHNRINVIASNYLYDLD